MDSKYIDRPYHVAEGIFMGSSGLAILEMAYEPTRFNEYVMIATISIGLILETLAWHIRNKRIKEIQKLKNNEKENNKQ